MSPTGKKETEYNEAIAEEIVTLYRFLQEQMKHRMQVKGLDGETPLMNATLTGNLALMNYLIDEGMEINATDDMGQNCVFYLTIEEDEDKAWARKTVELLKEAGASFSVKDRFGRTACDCAIEEGDTYLAELLKVYE